VLHSPSGIDGELVGNKNGVGVEGAGALVGLARDAREIQSIY